MLGDGTVCLASATKGKAGCVQKACRPQADRKASSAKKDKHEEEGGGDLKEEPMKGRRRP